MPKQCKHEGCAYNVFSGGYCQRHQMHNPKWQKKQKERKERELAKAKAKAKEPQKPRKAIQKRSKKRKGEHAIYEVVKVDYLAAHPKCEVHDCSNDSTHIHHKAGRTNQLLYNKKYFMAVCNDCHPHRIHMEANDGWAREHGYIITI